MFIQKLTFLLSLFSVLTKGVFSWSAAEHWRLCSVDLPKVVFYSVGAYETGVSTRFMKTGPFTQYVGENNNFTQFIEKMSVLIGELTKAGALLFAMTKTNIFNPCAKGNRQSDFIQV